jgi:hypothetical protein
LSRVGNFRVVPRKDIARIQDAAKDGDSATDTPSTRVAEVRLRKLEEWLENERVRRPSGAIKWRSTRTSTTACSGTTSDAQVLIDRGQAPLVYNKIQPA